MVKHHLFKVAPRIAAAAFSIALPLSCVNEEYDMSKIDTTVSVGGDALVFPLGSTEQLKLETLLSEEDFKYITSLDGVYGFTMDGEYNVPEEDIPDFSGALHIDPVSIDEEFNISMGAQGRIRNVPEADGIVVSGQFGTSEEITLFSFSDLPQELVSLNTVSFTETSFVISAEAVIPSGISGPVQVQLDVYLPEEIVTDDERVDENNVLHISGPIDSETPLTADPVTISGIDLGGVDFSTGEGDYTKEIRVEGVLSVDASDITAGDITGGDISLHLTGGIPEINIVSATGRIDYSLDDMTQNISLEELPEFVRGENVVLDFVNPYIVLDVSSNMGVPVTGEVKIIPVTGGTADADAMLTITGFEVPAAPSSSEVQTIRYWISGSAEGVPSGYTHLQADIASLLKTVPDDIEIRIEAGTDVTRDALIEPSATYKMGMTYNVVIPFEFGEDLDVVMDYTMEDLPDELGDILGMNSLGLAGHVESTLPLELTLWFELLDSGDNVIETEPATVSIAAGSDNAPSTSPIDVTLRLAEGADATDLSKIKLNFRVTSGNMSGEPVTENSYFQAFLQVKVPGGIRLDLDSLGNGENTDESQN